MKSESIPPTAERTSNESTGGEQVKRSGAGLDSRMRAAAASTSVAVTITLARVFMVTVAGGQDVGHRVSVFPRDWGLWKYHLRMWWIDPLMTPEVRHPAFASWTCEQHEVFPPGNLPPTTYVSVEGHLHESSAALMKREVWEASGHG